MQKHYSPRDVVRILTDEDIQFVDLRFTDLWGAQQHVAVPAASLTEDNFKNGLSVSSALGGSYTAPERELLVLPDPTTATVNPFTPVPTLMLTCSVLEPVTRMPLPMDPRNIARKAEAYLASTGIADLAYFDANLHFFILSEARLSQLGTEAQGDDCTDEVGAEKKKSLIPGLDELAGAADDEHFDLRNEMVRVMMEAGIAVEAHRNLGCAELAEIVLPSDTLVSLADQIALCKYILRNVARQQGRRVTFMPKPSVALPGAEMPVSQGLWKKTVGVFGGTGAGGLSDQGLQYVAGLLQHAEALCAFCMPLTNSYRRVACGEVPHERGYDLNRRSACCRVPAAAPGAQANQVEFALADASMNPYVAFSAMLLAGLDGIQQQLTAGDPITKTAASGGDNVDCFPPRSLRDALSHLAKDSEFLLKGEVFTEEIIQAWLQQKGVNEADQVDRRPHPHELRLYMDV